MASDRSGAAFAYRPALDGLRALAVLAVMCFHLGYPWAGGGFLGVDVFFVLSGYLITSLLLSERARTGRIDLAAFWARRARRLLPALGLVGAAILVAVPLTLTADALGMVRADGLATALYVANWRFATTGEAYFAQFADPSPLRHMWSLAVEEQFYLVWPIAVILVLRLAGRRRPAPGGWGLAGACAAGIAGSAALMALLYTPGTDPSRAYYGTDARIHELLVGALLAAVLHRRRVLGLTPGPRALQAARWAGPASVLVLAGCLALLDSHAAPYFRGGSLLACAAVAGLVLACEWGPARPVSRVLGVRPLRYIGRLSYGLYLWHWPIFIWMSGGVYGPRGPAHDGLRLGVTLLVAAASFHLVEQPIRRGALGRRPGRQPRPQVLRPLPATAEGALHVRRMG